MPTIALIEFQRHSEVLRSVSKILLFQRNKIKIFCSLIVKEDLYELLECKNIEWHVFSIGLSKRNFFQNNKEKLNSCEVHLFTTMLNGHLAYKTMNFKAKSILIIHNANTYLNPSTHINPAFSAKDILKYIRFFIIDQKNIYQEFVSTFDEIAFSSDEIKNHFHTHYSELLKRIKVRNTIPLAIYEGFQFSEKQDAFNIVVPGTIRNEGKNYEMLLYAFQNIQSQLNIKVTLCLLGNANNKFGKLLLNKFSTLDSKFLKLKSYNEILDQRTYDSHLRKANLIILPLKQNFKVGIINEQYGLTNISGGVNDMIRFGIPGILPKFYPLPSAVESLVSRYENQEELEKVLLTKIHEMDYFEKRRDFAKKLEHLSIENLAKNFEL